MRANFDWAACCFDRYPGGRKGEMERKMEVSERDAGQRSLPLGWRVTAERPQNSPLRDLKQFIMPLYNSD